MSLLRDRLPEGWQVEYESEAKAPVWGSRYFFDAITRITAPDQVVGEILVEAKVRFSPRDALLIGTMKDRIGERPVLVISPFLSRNTRARLQEEGLNWLDLTGNLRLAMTKPGLFLESQGAERRVGGGKRAARTIKGERAGRIVRTVLSAPLPIGVTDLAQLAGTDPGYTSRVVALLSSEALIERAGRGPVTAIDKVRLVRRWAEDAPLEGRGRVGTFLEPRGLGVLLDRLRNTEKRYAITGSFAAQRWAPVAAPRLAQIYVRGGLDKSAEELGLRPASEGANVQLIRPKDLTIVDQAEKGDDGLCYARPLQVVLDLLTSPGRGPAEGEELLRWMSERPDAWD